MKKTTLHIILFLLCIPVLAQKRGIAYGHHSPEDMQILSPAVSWWYNWSISPESTVASTYGNYGFDFVPMCWNGNYDETALRNFLQQHPETKYLLAFNEPNFLEQASMTPSQAAAQWPRLETIADEFNLKIVGPAVNFCGSCVSENGTTYTDPVQYLDDFLKACPNCRVDYIAIHNYMNTVSALQWYLGLFKKYNRPLWVTEFAGWESNGNISNANDQVNYLIGAVDLLESDADVFRYAWFTGRGAGSTTYPYIDLLGDNGRLTTLGEVYKKMPVHSSDQLITIPAQIESENYNSQSGFLLEKTSDTSGFAQLAYADAGDWAEYGIDVPFTGDYPIYFRFAAISAASFKLQVDGEDKLSVNLAATSSWQTWATAFSKIRLPGGQHKLRLVITSGAFNLNWVKLTTGTATAVTDIATKRTSFTAYPNPVINWFRVESSIPLQQLFLYNSTGQLVFSGEADKAIDVQKIVPGIYFLSATDRDNNRLKPVKLIIQNH